MPTGRSVGALALGLLAWGGSAGAGAAPTASTTTTTSTSDPSAFSARFVPCDAPAGGGPCRSEPTSIEVTPASKPSVTLSWTAQGTAKPSQPQPADVPCSGGVCKAQPWPLTAPGAGGPWVLNGTYTVGAGSSKATIGLAVPPPPPATAHAGYSPTAGVTVAWSPPGAAPPDVVGYRIARNGQAVFVCSSIPSGPVASAGPCPASRVFYDAPGAGGWTYGVTTLRYGAGPSASQVVASTPALASVVVPAAPPTTAALPLGGGGAVPTVATLPAAHSIVAVPPSTTLPASATTSPPTTAPGATSTTFAPSPTLPYQPPSGQRTALGSAETGPKNSGLHAWEAVALGLLMLALAAHVWYIRRELGNYRARHARSG